MEYLSENIPEGVKKFQVLGTTSIDELGYILDSVGHKLLALKIQDYNWTESKYDDEEFPDLAAKCGNLQYFALESSADLKMTKILQRILELETLKTIVLNSSVQELLPVQKLPSDISVRSKDLSWPM